MYECYRRRRRRRRRRAGGGFRHADAVGAALGAAVPTGLTLAVVFGATAAGRSCKKMLVLGSCKTQKPFVWYFFAYNA